jgi:type III pantothenate kinase
VILCLDVGNSTIHGAVFDGDDLRMEFRRASEAHSTSDELGVFLRAVLRENAIDWRSIEQIAYCSVVPDAVHSLRNCCLKYFDTAPFVLRAGAKTGLNIKYRNPLEVGADRIANAIGAVHLFPDRNVIVVDFGTATTFDVITRDRDYLGGAILAGPRLSIDALGRGTAKLSAVEIIKPDQVIGRSTVENIQSGLYFGQIGMIKELTHRITAEAFAEGTPPLVVGAGGFSGLFEDAGLFDEIVPDLVLRGVNVALRMNTA